MNDVFDHILQNFIPIKDNANRTTGVVLVSRLPEGADEKSRGMIRLCPKALAETIGVEFPASWYGAWLMYYYLLPHVKMIQSVHHKVPTEDEFKEGHRQQEVPPDIRAFLKRVQDVYLDLKLVSY